MTNHTVSSWTRKLKSYREVILHTIIYPSINALISEQKTQLQNKAQNKIDKVKARATKKVEAVISEKLNGLFKKRIDNDVGFNLLIDMSLYI